jgi:hypothetical protein
MATSAAKPEVLVLGQRPGRRRADDDPTSPEPDPRLASRS